MAKLYLEVVTPEKILASQEVDLVMAPGTDGEFFIGDNTGRASF
jgi:F0F1-type ATP synthase epsilon subunit